MSDFTYISVCSNIEAAHPALSPLGFRPLAFAEIAETPSAFLKAKFPSIINVGDFTQCDYDCFAGHVDLLIGGTPCQSFSLMGEGGADTDPRGQLAYEFFDLAKKIGSEWVIWENVPEALSADRGRFFPRLLERASQSGFHVAWRLLDTFQFGLPLRRERLFLVGHTLGAEGPCRVLDIEGRGGRGRVSDREKEIARRLAADGDLRPGASASLWLGSKKPVGRAETVHPLLHEHAKRHAVLRLDGDNQGSGGSLRLLSALEMERAFGLPDDYTALPGFSERDRQHMLGNTFSPTIVNWIGSGIVREKAALATLSR